MNIKNLSNVQICPALAYFIKKRKVKKTESELYIRCILHAAKTMCKKFPNHDAKGILLESLNKSGILSSLKGARRSTIIRDSLICILTIESKLRSKPKYSLETIQINGTEIKVPHVISNGANKLLLRASIQPYNMSTVRSDIYQHIAKLFFDGASIIDPFRGRLIPNFVHGSNTLINAVISQYEEIEKGIYYPRTGQYCRHCPAAEACHKQFGGNYESR